MTDAPASNAAPSAGDTSGQTGSAPTQTPTPAPPAAPAADQISNAIGTAVAAIIATTVDPAAIATDQSNLLQSLLPAQPKVLNDPNPCTAPDLTIATACDQRASDVTDATSQCDATCLSAEHDLATAIATWNTAQKKYTTAAKTAQTALKVTVKALVDPYQIKQGDGTGSRSAHLYLTLKEGAATALKTYETSVATAAGTLAIAAGAVMTAFTTYVSAIKGAQADALVQTVLADQTLWGSIETVHFLD